MKMVLFWKLFLVFCVLSISSRWHGSFAYGTLFVPITNGSLPGKSFVMPTIFWDPSNPIFNCPNKGTNTINIRMNDYFRLACPKPGRFVNWHESPNVAHGQMYGNAFLTQNKTAVDHCTAESSWPFILECNDPLNSNKYRTVRIAQHSGIDSDPLFQFNTTYYIFSTATGSSSGINNRVGGRCSNAKENEYKMILKLRVCANGEAGTEKCPICNTAACYHYGCGKYSDWKKTDRYQRVNNSCYIVYQRTCDYSGGYCDGPSEKFEETNSSYCIEPSKISKYNFTNTYVNRNNSCKAVFTKACYQVKNGVTTSCSETQQEVDVPMSYCTKKSPVTGERCSEKPKTLSLSTAVVSVVPILIFFLGVLIGICSFRIYVRKDYRPNSLHEGYYRRSFKC